MLVYTPSTFFNTLKYLVFRVLNSPETLLFCIWPHIYNNWKWQLATSELISNVNLLVMIYIRPFQWQSILI